MPVPYEVYAYFNVDTLTGVFNGVAAIMGADDFAGLMKTVSALAGFIVLFSAAVNMRGMEMNVLPFIFWMLITHTLLFTPRTDVIITDRTGGQPPQVVSNIPLGLAFFAGFTSQAGDWFTRSFEAVFALPDDIQYHNSGLLFGQKLVRTVQSASISDINLRTDLQNFFRNCTFYDLLPSGNNPPLIDPNAFQNSPDIWSLMSNTSVARGTTYHDRGNGGIEVSATCANTYNILNGYLTGAIQTAMNYYGWQVNPTATSQAAAGAMFDSQVQASYSYLLNASQSASDLIKQAALINAADDAGMFTALQTGDAAAAQVAIAKAQATAMANSAGITKAKMAEETLPIIRNTVEVLIIGMFPFLILMCIIAADKAPMVLRGYFMSMVWVQLWAPLYAIMNYIIASKSAKVMQAIAQSGLTIESAMPLNAQAVSDMASAGDMVWAVPVIAGFIAKFFDTAALTAIAKGTSAESVGAQVGSAAGAGNFSMGQANMDTAKYNMRSGNQFNEQHTWYDNHGVKHTTTSGGDHIVDMGGTVSNLGAVGIKGASRLSSAAQKQSEAAETASVGNMVSYAQTTAASIQQYAGFEQGHAKGERAGVHDGAGEGSSASQAVESVQQSIKQFAKDHQLNEKQAAEVMLAAEASAKVGGKIPMTDTGASVGVVARLTGKSTAEAAQILKAAQQFNEQTGFSQKVDAVRKAVHEQTFDTSDESTRRGVEGVRASLDSGEQALSQASANHQRSLSYKELASQARENSVAVDRNLNQKFFEWVADQPDSYSKIPGKKLGVEGAVDVMRDDGRREFYASEFLRKVEQQELHRFGVGDPSGPQDVKDFFNRGAAGIPGHDAVTGKGNNWLSGARSQAASAGVAPTQGVSSNVPEQVREQFAQNNQAINQGHQNVINSGAPIKTEADARTQPGSQNLAGLAATNGLAQITPDGVSATMLEKIPGTNTTIGTPGASVAQASAERDNAKK